MSKPNITYYLGAGASYNAYPILTELGVRMIGFAKRYLSIKAVPANKLNFDSLVKHETQFAWAWDIGYFGNKALDYGTIDTYAKVLMLNGEEKQLARLKAALSTFITLWEFVDDEYVKPTFRMKSEDNGKRIFADVDKRYLALLSNFLERDEVSINRADTINFISWNYDFQVQRAIGKLILNEFDYWRINVHLPFDQFSTSSSPLSLTQLNGYAGFWSTKESPEVVIGVRNAKFTLDQSLDDLDHIVASTTRGEINWDNLINYAWEKSELVSERRERAKEIIRNTNTLIIIGYSFPSFNREIDRELFNEIQPGTHVVYQDPNANEEILNHLLPSAGLPNRTNGITTKILKETNQFHLPLVF
jgi:hypothetical protein